MCQLVRSMVFLMALVSLLLGCPAWADEPVQDGKTLSEWIKLLGNKDAEERYKAAQAIGQLGKDAKTGLKPLMATLKDKEASVRSAGAEALGRILCELEAPQAEVKQTLPGLVQLFKDNDYAVRASAARACGDLGRELKGQGPEVKMMVLAMTEGLKDAKFEDYNNTARCELLASLGRIAMQDEMQAKTIIPVLVPFLKDKDAGVRKYAVESIGDCEDKAKPAFKSLLPLLKDSDADVRRAAGDALKKIDEEEAKKAGVRD